MAETLSRISIIGTAKVSVITVTATAETVTITVKDLSRTFVRVTNNSGSVATTITISASDDPMVAEGIGSLSFALPSSQSCYIGGSWDSARFKGTAGTIVLTPDLTATGVTFEVGELPPY